MRGVAIALALVAVAVAVSVRRGLGLERDLAVAVVRALLQLIAVAAVVHVVLAEVGLSGVLLAAMVGLAALTAGRRLRGVPRAPLLAAAAISSATAVAMAVLFGAQALPFEGRYVVPIGGMLIGNAMTAVSVAGARLRDEIVDKTLEIESRLALGAPADEALRDHARRALVASLIPIVDSTKNVGLIFLPGAFVGMILGGRSPAEAAQVQLVVLFMLLGAVAVAAMVGTSLVARAFIAPGERIVIPPELVR